MMKMQKKQKDERIIAETNKIYKIGFHILTIGILIDLFLQFTNVSATEHSIGFSFRVIEFGAFMAAQIVCVALMARKGMMDNNKYAEAEIFPKKYYLRVSLIAGVATGLAFSALVMFFNPYQLESMQQKFLVGGLLFAFLLCLTAISIYVTYYIIFRLAKKRRAKIYESQD